MNETQQWLDDVFAWISKKLEKTVLTIGDTLAYTTENGKYIEWPFPDYVSFWTNGFWPGLLWLMYNETGNHIYKETAERAEDKLDEALFGYDGLNHDVGFMWLLSSVANYRLTGNDKSRKRGLTAASMLASRYRLGGGFIRAWDDRDNGVGGGRLNRRGWAIIDCMMNIPILYWASKETGDERFEEIAKAHADKSMEVFVRSDGSVNHIVSMNPLTGDVIEALGGQGFSADSSWSRGQAWALYGFALSYAYTKNEAYLDTAKRVAHYFIADLAMKDDFVPDCDFRQPKGKAVKDSAAGAIAASGLIEISKHVGENEKDLYLNGAVKILKALDERCGVWDDSCECMIKGGAGAYHDSASHDMALIYADFYFTEAITKLRGQAICISSAV